MACLRFVATVALLNVLAVQGNTFYMDDWLHQCSTSRYQKLNSSSSSHTVKAWHPGNGLFSGFTCILKFSVLPAGQLAIRFTTFNASSYIRLQFYDGNSSSSTMLMSLSNNDSAPFTTVYTTGSTLLVNLSTFSSSATSNSYNFHFTVSTNTGTTTTLGNLALSTNTGTTSTTTLGNLARSTDTGTTSTTTLGNLARSTNIRTTSTTTLGNLALSTNTGTTTTLGNLARSTNIRTTGTTTLGNLARSTDTGTTGTTTLGNLARSTNIRTTGITTLGNLAQSTTTRTTGTTTLGNLAWSTNIRTTGTTTLGNLARSTNIRTTGTTTLRNLARSTDTGTTPTPGNLAPTYRFMDNSNGDCGKNIYLHYRETNIVKVYSVSSTAHSLSDCYLFFKSADNKGIIHVDLTHMNISGKDTYLGFYDSDHASSSNILKNYGDRDRISPSSLHSFSTTQQDLTVVLHLRHSHKTRDQHFRFTVTGSKKKGKDDSVIPALPLIDGIGIGTSSVVLIIAAIIGVVVKLVKNKKAAGKTSGDGGRHVTNNTHICAHCCHFNIWRWLLLVKL